MLGGEGGGRLIGYLERGCWGGGDTNLLDVDLLDAEQLGLYGLIGDDVDSLDGLAGHLQQVGTPEQLPCVDCFPAPIPLDRCRESNNLVSERTGLGTCEYHC